MSSIRICTLPNMVSLLNLICGMMAIILVIQNPDNLVYGSYLIGLALVFDYLDGFLARILKAGSGIGKELDSLADMVSFGLFPGIVIYYMLCRSWFGQEHPCIFNPDIPDFYIISFLSVLVPAFSALRLAKFNIDERQSETFIGLPTPANAIFFCSLIVVWQHFPGHLLTIHLQSLTYLIAGFVLLSCFLLISEIKMISLKFKNYTFNKNKERYLFLFGALMLLIFFQYFAIPLIILFYILISIVNKIFGFY
jgi:CDP-diacylglycerol---serine O-phosphatidyltransferase